MSLALTNTLAWVVVAGFTLSALLAVSAERDRAARVTAAGAWTVFAVFWGLLIEHFLVTENSFVEGGLAALAVPLCLYTGYLVLTDRPSLLRLSRAVAVMGVIYLPFQTIPELKRAAISFTAESAHAVITALGYAPVYLTDPYPHAFLFVTPEQRFLTEIVLACSGIGSIAIVSGLVAATDAPIRRRLQGVALVAPIIYVLNVVRVTFITLAHGNQWFDWTQPLVFAVFATTNPYKVSYLFADKVLAQSLSVVALVAITLGLLRLLPELASILDDALYVATRNEYDLRERVT